MLRTSAVVARVLEGDRGLARAGAGFEAILTVSEGEE